MTGGAPSIKQILIDNLYDWDSDRPRTQQVEMGASSAHGCRRQAYLRLVGAPEINETERLGSILGTFIHEGVERAFRAADPRSERWMTEMEVPGDPSIGLGDAHIDLYDKLLYGVWDWKTIKMKDLRYVPKDKHWSQTMIYGDRLRAAGHRVDTVGIVYIPRDGETKDIAPFARPYDQRIADHAKAWVADVKSAADNEVLPPADYSGRICTDFCPFYTSPDAGLILCTGKPQ